MINLNRLFDILIKVYERTLQTHAYFIFDLLLHILSMMGAVGLPTWLLIFFMLTQLHYMVK